MGIYVGVGMSPATQAQIVVDKKNVFQVGVVWVAHLYEADVCYFTWHLAVQCHGWWTWDSFPGTPNNAVYTALSEFLDILFRS